MSWPSSAQLCPVPLHTPRWPSGKDGKHDGKRDGKDAGKDAERAGEDMGKDAQDKWAPHGKGKKGGKGGWPGAVDAESESESVSDSDSASASESSEVEELGAVDK